MQMKVELSAVISAPQDDVDALWGQVEELRNTLAQWGACTVAMSTEDASGRYPESAHVRGRRDA